MHTATYVAFVLIASAVFLLRNGPTQTTLLILMGFALVAAIPWYFGTRDHAARPSRFERAAATLWVWLRRLVGFTAGALLMAASFGIASSDRKVGDPAHPLLIATVLFLMGLFCIYVGIVGQGPKRYQWKDDVALHRKNKRRYRWWF